MYSTVHNMVKSRQHSTLSKIPTTFHTKHSIKKTIVNVNKLLTFATFLNVEKWLSLWRNESLCAIFVHMEKWVTLCYIRAYGEMSHFVLLLFLFHNMEILSVFLFLQCNFIFLLIVFKIFSGENYSKNFTKCKPLEFASYLNSFLSYKQKINFYF